MYEFLQSSRVGESTGVPPALRSAIEDYIRSQDVVKLKSIINSFTGYGLRRLIDINSKQSFFLVYDQSSRLVLIASLLPRNREKRFTVSIKQSRPEDISEFINSGTAFLEFGSGS